MRRRIYKYEIVPTMDHLLGMQPEAHVQMPREAEILHVDAQGDRMFVWAIVDPRMESARYSFIILPTGAEVGWPPESQIWHIGTVLMHGGTLVWHIFGDGQARP